MSAATDPLKDFFGDKEIGYYSLHGELILPDSYRRVIIQYPINHPLGPPKPQEIEQWARERGWRLLKVTSTTASIPQMEDFNNFVAYAMPNATAMTLGSLAQAIDGFVIMEKATVPAHEKIALDTLWLAQGEIEKANPKVRVSFPIVPIVVGGIVLLGVGYFLFRRRR